MPKCDVDIAIGSNTKFTACMKKFTTVEYTITQIGFCNGTQSSNCPSLRQLRGCLVRNLGAVDKAPSIINTRIIHKPLCWARIKIGKYFVDFVGLFGQMHVNWPSRAHILHAAQSVWRDCTQRMGRNPNPEI